MAIGDIKDAGILAKFVVWGWPWHGLIQSGTIGTTGQNHTQPDSNDSWLIDRDLDPLGLSAGQIAEYAALGMEWHNYALLPRGYVYGTEIGTDAYIHVDEAGDCWRIELAFSFPATDTLRITATVSRFGLLTINDEVITPSTIEKTADVDCTSIEIADLNAALTLPLAATYESRAGELHDVHTNGSKALVGVMLTDDQICKDMLSLVELTFSGSGGEDGTSLVMEAVEIMDQTELTLGEWGYAPAYQTLYTRYAYYKAGVATAMAIRATVEGYFLLENNVVVDQVGWNNVSYPNTPLPGSLAAYFPVADDYVGSNTGIGFIWRAFRHVNDSYLTEDIEISVDVDGVVTFSGKVLGLHRMRTKAVAFIMTGTENRYGTVITNIGHLSLADAPNQNIQFAVNRKTSEYTFATSAICYV